jgi:hypothetical protein
MPLSKNMGIEKKLDAAPQKCTLSHLPRSVAVFGEEPNSSYHIPHISLCITFGSSKASKLGSKAIV